MKSNDILIEMNIKLTKIAINLEKIINPNNWINLYEAAKYAGLSVSTIRRAIANGTLRCSRRSGKILLKHESIDGWLND